MIASIFERAMAASDAVIDSINAEGFEFRPMRGVRNADPIIDPARSVLPSVMATFFNAADQLTSGEAIARASSNPVISVMAGRIPQGIREGDRFKRLADGVVYAVSAPRPDEFGRVELDVHEVAREPVA